MASPAAELRAGDRDEFRASLAGDVNAPRPREIIRLLAPFPGRASIVTRIALICALTALVNSAYGVPEAATSAYIVFFLNRPDRVTSVVMSCALFLLVTAIIGIVMVFAIFSIDVPALRVGYMALLSFGLLFVTSASKLRPVGVIVAMIVGFGLDELGLAPVGEAATRGLLYAWLFVSIPIGIAIVVNLLIGPSPRRLANAKLAQRLKLAAACLTDTADAAGRAAFEASLREGDHQILTWLKLATLEGSLKPVDAAALRQAAASTTAILIAVDLATSERGARLPPACAAQFAETFTQMAAMLNAGGYPIDITAPAADEKALAPLAAVVLKDLRAALEHFAVAPEAPAPAPKPAQEKPAHKGFFDADAFTNPDHVRYALKTTAAAMFCYLLYQQLDWQGIHTCFITCYMVSLGTTAETVEKLTLRIAGCLIGAALGTAAIVFVTPMLTTAWQLMALVFAGAWLAGWVAMGSPRIAYAGMQIAFAFFLCVIQGAAPAFDLTLARDRAIGILIGNVVIYLVFTRVWPVSIAGRIDAALAKLVAQWTRIAHATDVATRRALAAAALADYGGLRQNLGLIHYEPSWVRPPPAWIASRRRALAELGALEAPLFLAAGQAGAEGEARLNELARQLAPEGEATQRAPTTLQAGCAATPHIDALLELIAQRYARIAATAATAAPTAPKETPPDARP
ncbi:multidrug resistance protein MdtO [Paraburkholderia bannensis]|uniref:Multidrug resistance protein MdtO n=1 Tax=Paraburkholderia bannensis TaxID=765414 RepID=A0A7W9TX53_9BURK|nr:MULTISPECIES: FUSC family protein [Paraburkholderia]MBB3257268.1 multidrug resistance protein MdtO [Paraburkholderia sp. WP4_3_2]MBB6102336.1 multidrug resistance protein MdtO [Paraburkholderia bannensis]